MYLGRLHQSRPAGVSGYPVVGNVEGQGRPGARKTFALHLNSLRRRPPRAHSDTRFPNYPTWT